ncbi:MAG: sulfatase-like hydrolase/transferase [Tetrasphaera sp.]
MRKILGDPATGANYNTTWVGTRAGEFLDRAMAARAADGTPFFMEFDPTAPHLHDEQNTARNMTEPKYRNLAVPGCAAPTVESDRTDKPAYVQAFPLTDPYSYGVICPVAQRTLRSLDDWFGATIDRLTAAGQLDQTLIVFTSDNGLMYGEHGLSRKYVPYEPSVRVPLMLAYPGVFAPGTTAAANASRALVSNIDILPTILSVTGTPVNPALPKIDGVSLVAKPAGHKVVLSEYWGDPRWAPSVPAPIPTWSALYDRRWTFAITYDTAGRAVTQELYDRVRDPKELTNLIPLRAGATSSTYDVPRWTARLNAERRCAGASGARMCH